MEAHQVGAPELFVAQRQLEDLLKLNFDPNDARSAVAKIGTMLTALERDLDTRFDPKRRDSVLGRFDERMEARAEVIERSPAGRCVRGRDRATADGGGSREW
jgi:hypothetical protein